MRITAVLTLLLFAVSTATAAEKLTDEDIEFAEEPLVETVTEELHAEEVPSPEPSAQKPAPDLDKFYDSREAASDSDDVADVGPRFPSQPGLRECSEDEDCTVIEGICAGVPEPVNILRKAAKEANNLKAREAGACTSEVTKDPKYNITGAVCAENECVIKKRRN